MDEATKNRIFEPFCTANRQSRWVALGLFIAYNLVTAQWEGSIRCKSTPGGEVHLRIEHPLSRV